MFKKHSVFISIVVLLIASLACSQSGAAPALDPNAVNTSIAQTISARQTQAAPSVPATATLTFTPEQPTLTFTPILSPTSEFTATPASPQITVSVDTNCRVGPGKLYERVGILLVGESATIVGRDGPGQYWYIQNPDNPSGFCWVWGEYATFSGNLLTLLLFTPQAPPVASFSVAFDALNSCGPWWVDIKITNKSDASIKSISLTVQDVDKDTVVSLVANKFTTNQGCAAPTSKDMLAAGDTVIVSSPSFAYNPTGHAFKARIILCTDTDQKGTCITQEISFKP